MPNVERLRYFKNEIKIFRNFLIGKLTIIYIAFIASNYALISAAFLYFEKIFKIDLIEIIKNKKN